MSVPTREEFKGLIGAAYSAIVNYESDPSRSCGADIDVAERGLTAAYDAALARIAELDPLCKRIITKLHAIVARNPEPDGSLGMWLEDVIDRQITALMRENELLGQHNARLQGPAHRARIAREFYDEATSLYTDAALYESPLACIQDLLARWEAAAKEGK